MNLQRTKVNGSNGWIVTLVLCLLTIQFHYSDGQGLTLQEMLE